MKRKLLTILLVAAFAATNTPAPGQGENSPNGWGRSGNYQRLYNRSTVETVRGEIVDIEEFTPFPGMHRGVRLSLKVDEEIISVHLGPKTFVDAQDVKMEVGYIVRVTGSRGIFGGEPALVAARIERGDEVLELRDDLGFPLWAAGKRTGDGWGSQGRYQRLYNPGTVQSATGDVLTIEQFTPMGGMDKGVHLKLKCENETVMVHIGPARYLDGQEVRIARGDRITVKGSRITFSGKPAIIASEIQKGDDVLRLRDENGLPLWAGWRRKTE